VYDSGGYCINVDNKVITEMSIGQLLKSKLNTSYTMQGSIFKRVQECETPNFIHRLLKYSVFLYKSGVIVLRFFDIGYVLVVI